MGVIVVQAKMALPRLLQHFASQGCFTLDEAVAATGQARKTVKKDVEYLQARGLLESARRGLYALTPQAPGAEPDPFVVASKVTQPHVFSHHSALELHGVAESAFYRRITVATPTPFRPFTWRGHEVHATAIDPDVLAEGRRTVHRAGAKLWVAGPELTVIQCADRPDLVGGFAEAVASIRGFPYLDWGPLLRLLDMHGKTVLYRKVGYLVAANADRWRPPDAVLDQIRKRLGASATYFGVQPKRSGRLERDWHVIVPADAPEASARA